MGRLHPPLSPVSRGVRPRHRTLCGPHFDGLVHGLKLVAVAVVAQAVHGMARTLAPDLRRGGIAFAAMALVLLWAGSLSQILAIIGGALAGCLLCRGESAHQVSRLEVPVTRRAGVLCLCIGIGLLLLLPLLAPFSFPAALADAFYRSGALVFGARPCGAAAAGSLHRRPGWVSSADFLTGYGLAQAVPGPLFTFASYLGATAAAWGEPCSPPWPSSCRACCSWWAPCPSGTRCATCRWRAPPCAGPMRPWWECWGPRFTAGLDQRGAWSP